MAHVKVDAQLRINLAGVSREVESEVFTAVYAAGGIIAAEAAHSITEGSISGPGHVPSLPGQPPNADTRQLDTNIVAKPDRDRVAVQVLSQAPYSAALEYGTSRMEARPFMRRALNANAQEARDLVHAAVKRATTKR